VEPDEVARYVERVERRRRNGRVARLGFGLALAGGIFSGVVRAAMMGDDWACHYGISRENYAVPDLTGLTLNGAAAKLPSCVDVVPSDPTLAEDPDARIVDQEPAPPDDLNERRSVDVVIVAPPSDKTR
jgi:hypothetical protein